MRRGGWISVTVIAGTTALLLALLAFVLDLAGTDPGLALGAMWRGSLGSRDALTSATLVRAVPLLLTGLAVALAFRAGVWNIGAEGQLLVGAAAGAGVGVSLATWPPTVVIPLAIAAGAIAGGSWAGIAAHLRRRHAVPEVIATIMLNFIALHVVGFLVRGPLQEPSGIYPQSATLPDVMRLPLLVPGTRLHVGLVLALVAAMAVWWMLRATAVGFRIRVTGANPVAARTAGLIDVGRTASLALVASGVLAGVAGVVEVTGVTFALYENISPGYGYLAIAVALLARLHPIGVIGTAVLFGALESGALAMQREAGVPSTVVAVIEALLILAILAGNRWQSGLGLPEGWLPGRSRSRVASMDTP